MICNICILIQRVIISTHIQLKGLGIYCKDRLNIQVYYYTEVYMYIIRSYARVLLSFAHHILQDSFAD